MRKTLQRGKQQVIFNHLPQSTLDFGDRVFAKIMRIRGSQATSLNADMVLRKIEEEARAWPEEFRPALRDDILRDPARFVLLDPRDVEAELFPKVFWCDNKSSCGRVFNSGGRASRLQKNCPTCKTGRLNQLRFVTVHRCGELAPLVPPPCPNGHGTSDMALETRGSERIAGFRWMCRRCGTAKDLFAGMCRACQWPDPQLRTMSIEVHRARRTYYAQYTTLLNVPSNRFNRLLRDSNWPVIVAAKLLDFPELQGQRLEDCGRPSDGTAEPANVPASQLDELIKRQLRGEITAEQLMAELQRLTTRSTAEQDRANPTRLGHELHARSGVPISRWEQAAQQVLEALLPMEIGRPQRLSEDQSRTDLQAQSVGMGLQEVMVLDDFPMIIAAYGFTRTEDGPRSPGRQGIVSRLNPFPADRDHAGRTPIFVDQVNADAIVLKLDPSRVLTWLSRNGINVSLPRGSDAAAVQTGYFVDLFADANLRETIPATLGAQRMVFGLLHSLSHLAVRQAALLSGLERTSLSEYLLPGTLTAIIYCNHRFGATIGALTSLYEQSLGDWLAAIRGAHRCVYDPVCYEAGGNCHACTHAAETSCRFFNLNLSRSFLFGGLDDIVGAVNHGYFQV